MEKSCTTRDLAPVCVVIPCFKCEKTIRRAVESVARQTWRPESVIIVDDASGSITRDSLQVLKDNYDNGWLQVIALSENRGPAHARNAGWNSAKQPYVAFLDADDSWHPEKIEMQCRWMMRHPEAALSGHKTIWLRQAESWGAPMDKVTGTWISKWRLLLSNCCSMRSVMIRRDLSIRLDSDMRHMEDYMFLLRVAFSGNRLAMLDGPIAYIYKADYGDSGLSAQLWKMEKGEIRSYWRLRSSGSISYFIALVLTFYSLLKYLKRLSVVGIRRSYGR